MRPSAELSRDEPATSFTIPGRLPGLNEVSWKERSHWSKGAKLRKKIEADIGMWILIHHVPRYTGPVAIHVDWHEKDRRRDRDNIRSAIKFVLDSLVSTGRIVDDSQKYVRDITDGWHKPDPKNPRIIVTILPLAA